MPLEAIHAADKTILFNPGWIEPLSADGYARYHVPLAVGGVLDTALTLSVGTYIHRPDRHVTFELALRESPGCGYMRLERLDWRDIRGGHSNSRRTCSGPWAGRRVPASHVHSFDLNYVAADERMKRGKLPCAEPLVPEPQSFEELRTLVGSLFNINNIDIVPRPPWRYNLFNVGGNDESGRG